MDDITPDMMAFELVNRYRRRLIHEFKASNYTIELNALWFAKYSAESISCMTTGTVHDFWETVLVELDRVNPIPEPEN